MPTLLRSPLLALPLLATLGACQPPVTWTWSDARALPHAEGAPPRDVEVVTLLEEVRLTVDAASYAHSHGYSRLEVHRIDEVVAPRPTTVVTQILLGDEEGIGGLLQPVRALRLLRTRTIDREGGVHEIDPGQATTKTAEPVADCDAVRYRELRLEAVAPGTRVESVWITDLDSIPAWWQYQISGERPIRHQRIDIDVADGVTFDVRTQNQPTPLVREERNGRIHMSLVVDGVPAATRVPLAPPPRMREPWLSYRTRSFTLLGGRKQQVAETWADALREWIQIFGQYHEDDSRHRVPGVERGDSSRENIRHAWDAVVETLAYSGDDGFACARSSQDILDSNRATATEKALLLGRALAQQHLDFGFVLTSREDGEAIDPDLPLPGRFDHLLLHVPPQNDLTDEVWLDPACERCRVGQVAPEVNGQPAMIVRPTVAQTSIKIRRIAAPTADVNLSRYVLDARLEPDLAVTVEEQRQVVGTVAAELLGAPPSAQAWHERAQREIEGRVPSAIVDSADLPRCTRATGTCEWTLRYRVPAYAQRDGEQVKLPAALLPRSLVDELGDASRTLPIAPQRLERVEHLLTLHLPRGWTLAGSSPPLRRELGPIAVTGEIVASPSAIQIRRTVDVKRGALEPSDGLRQLAQQWTSLRETPLSLGVGAASR